MSEIDIRHVGYFQLWPRQKKRWFALLLLLWALALSLAFLIEQQRLDPFQRCYLPTYIRTTLYLDSSDPQTFSHLMLWWNGTWSIALPPSLPDYTGQLIPDQIPSPLPPDHSFRWDSTTLPNSGLRLFLRRHFFANRPLFSWAPWSQPCVYPWSCLIALAFPFTILGAFLIDFKVAKRLRSGIVKAGTRLHTRTTFLRRIVRWKKFLWAPWKLGLTFRVIGQRYPSDFLLAPFWLLACLFRNISAAYHSEFTDKRILWIPTAITSLFWLALVLRVHELDIHLADGIPSSHTFFTLLPLICFCVLLTLATSALFLPATWLRLSNALHPCILGIPADKENQHLLLMGDTGTGKSSLLRQIIRSIRDRRETLVIYDPDGTYASEFYDPERGDVILNPLDSRCPYWQPNAEIHDAGEAETLAAGYYPQIPKSSGSTEFFYTAARKILAFLFTHRATAAEIADWLSDPEKLTNLLKHTELKQYVAEYAGQMRGGVEATLSAVVNGLRLLPSDYQDPDPNNPNAALQPRPHWSALTWSQTRQGWVFITNDKAHRLSLMPLISAWLDNILLRLMATKPQGTCPNVWVVMDELASLHRLPQLEVGLTEIRKHHVSMVLGFQGIAQLQENYTEHPSEVILSQPATKIFLRTSENKGGKWISDYLGQQDIEITSETKSQKTGTNFSKKTEKVSLVSPTTIQHMDDLTGYMSHGNFVTSLVLPYTEAVERHPAFLPRLTKPFTLREPPLSVRPAPSDPPPDACSGFWFGGLAIDWALYKKPVTSKQLEFLVNRFHPVSGAPLATNGIGLTQECLNFSLPIAGPVPPDPNTPIPNNALLAHYEAVLTALDQRFPTDQYGKYLGLLLNEDPTPTSGNSSLMLNSTVYLCHGSPSAPRPNPPLAPRTVDQPPSSASVPTPNPTPSPKSNRKRLAVSAPTQPGLQLVPAPPASSIAVPGDQLTLPGLQPLSDPAAPVAPRPQPGTTVASVICPLCNTRIKRGSPQLLTDTGLPRHRSCPIARAHS